jgi:hypothetical protein
MLSGPGTVKATSRGNSRIQGPFYVIKDCIRFIH